MTNLDEAFRLCARMLKAGIVPNVVVYTSLIYRLCGDDRMTEASLLFGKNEDNRGADP